MARMEPEDPTEMALIGETAEKSDLGKREILLLKQGHGVLNTGLQQPCMRRETR